MNVQKETELKTEITCGTLVSISLITATHEMFVLSKITSTHVVLGGGALTLHKDALQF